MYVYVKFCLDFQKGQYKYIRNVNPMSPITIKSRDIGDFKRYVTVIEVYVQIWRGDLEENANVWGLLG